MKGSIHEQYLHRPSLDYSYHHNHKNAFQAFRSLPSWHWCSCYPSRGGHGETQLSGRPCLRCPRNHGLSRLWLLQHRRQRRSQRLSGFHRRSNQLPSMRWTILLWGRQLFQLGRSGYCRRRISSELVQFPVPEHQDSPGRILSGKLDIHEIT